MAKSKPDKNSEQQTNQKRTPVVLIVKLDGVQYTTESAVQTVKSIFDRTAVNYVSVKPADG